VNDFDTAMLARLRASKAEASRVVLDLYKGGRKLPDAIVDAIESMSWKKTAQLRRWQENWKAWLEWMKFQERGYMLRIVSGWGVYVTSPSRSLPPGPAKPFPVGATKQWSDLEWPTDEAVAAGADVREVQFRAATPPKAHETMATLRYRIVT
jgi:hypothetical protein